MAKRKVYTIQITGLAADDYWFGEQRQSDANTEWRNALRDARNNKAEARVICLCMGKNEDHALRRLVVRYRTDTDKFYLSAWKFTGGQHRHGLYRESAHTGAGRHTTAPAVQQQHRSSAPVWHGSAPLPDDGIFLTGGITADGLHISR